MMGLLGRKVGMSQMYDSNDNLFGVTIVDVSGNTVLAVRSEDGNDGYNAIQLGIDEQKEARVNQPDMGNFRKAGVSPRKFVREVRLSKDAASGYAIGQDIGAADVFAADAWVDVIGTSKGRGFAGVMKRHNFAGFIRSHGTHEYFRHGGSIGTRLTPGHVLKGKKMPGQYGNKRNTVQNLKLIKVDAERGLLYIRGGVPGPNGGYVMVRKAIKKS
ncbi:MAG: 50S ribosomal protein L3 [Deltaproteobacteria bacterium]|nr:50S ribosomal protein L3 [Deltaproteobacteria bacterium]HCH63433.1 50S ribosomal protein L3 [Deltaproteobacteria bacterium]